MSFLPNQRIFDGYPPAVPHQMGPPRPSWDPITKGQQYEITYRVPAEAWVAEAMDSVGPSGGNLVSESIPRNVGAGLVEWDRKYMFLPPSRTTAESIAYPVQALVTSGSSVNLVEIPLTTTASMVFDYFHTTAPGNIPILHAYRLTKVAENTFYFIGTKPADDAQLIIALDSSVRWIAGFFYERKTPWIPPITPAVTSS